MNMKQTQNFRKQEELFKEATKQAMEKVQLSGMMAGTTAICGIVLEKAKAENKTDSERLADIVEFCEKSLSTLKKTEKQNENN